MTTEVLIGLLVVLIPAVASVWVAIANHNQLQKLEISINGRLTQLLKVSGEASHAEGVVAGSMDSAAITAALSKAISEAVAVPAPSGVGPVQHDTLLATDTNRIVHGIKDDAATVAAALIVKNAAAIAAALIIKTAEEAAESAKQPD